MHKYLSKKTQQGRTMTEMIAVLILAGILSIGGLSVYGYTVDKNRANTLSTELLMRGAELKKQIDNRAHSFHLTKFSNTVLGHSITLPNEENPIILVTSLNERMCNLLKDKMQKLAKITGNCDTGQNALALDFGGEEFEVLLDQRCHDSCGECEVCKNRQCTPAPENSSCTTEDGDKGICINTICEAGRCSSNNDCSEGQYCADTNESDINATPYLCQDLPNMTEYQARGNSYYLSDKQTSWWDANNICLAYSKIKNTNMTLLSLNDFTQNNSALAKELKNIGFSSTTVWTSTEYSKISVHFMWLAQNDMKTRIKNDSDQVLCGTSERTLAQGTECTQSTDCYLCNNGWIDTTSPIGTQCVTENGVSGRCDGNGLCVLHCTTSNDCETGSYCYDTNESRYTPHPENCQPLPNITSYTVRGKTYYLADETNWWNANNICIAIGKQIGMDGSLISYDEFNANNATLSKALRNVMGAHGVWAETEMWPGYAYTPTLGISLTGGVPRTAKNRKVLCHIPNETAQPGTECTGSTTCSICENGWTKLATPETECITSSGTKGVCGKTGTCDTICTTSDDCEKGFYCYDKNESSYQATPVSCAPIPIINKTATIQGKTYYLMGNSTVSWWDAKNICTGLGNQKNTTMTLVPKEVLEADNSALHTALTTLIPSQSFWTETESGSSAYRSAYKQISTNRKVDASSSRALCYDPN